MTIWAGNGWILQHFHNGHCQGSMAETSTVSLLDWFTQDFQIIGLVQEIQCFNF